MNYIIDGEPDYLRGFDPSPPDSSYFELITTPIYGGPNTPEIVAARAASNRESWRNDPQRRVRTAALMSTLRKSGVIQPHYTPERNAKIAAYHQRQRIAKQGEMK